MGTRTSVAASRPRAGGAVRPGTRPLGEHSPRLGALGVYPGVGRLRGIYYNFESAQAWAGSEASTATSKTSGSKSCVLGVYCLAPSI
ncbi:hypothetical protein E2562_032598 [Oryza meyeriana var. granulata]|uniref:Uncharacterized protein n=1 Tax=Oryza meyeriana var. granulata TaxID=110450 RepID=A0A6G1EC90_9ORYZ|nr:hypothetical protein E2562_032598 [Oryza meyeriana var. granulata]